jgi:hypothetical protein
MVIEELEYNANVAKGRKLMLKNRCFREMRLENDAGTGPPGRNFV